MTTATTATKTIEIKVYNQTVDLHDENLEPIEKQIDIEAGRAVFDVPQVGEERNGVLCWYSPCTWYYAGLEITDIEVHADGSCVLVGVIAGKAAQKTLNRLGCDRSTEVIVLEIKATVLEIR